MGLIIVISAPSGAGKTTLYHELKKRMPELLYSISVTTRPPRPGEINGKDYYFVSEKEFKKKIKKKEFIEWARVHKHYYGTPKKSLEKMLEGKNIVLDIDVQGGRKVKKICPNGVFIFVLPPSQSVWKQRLLNRKQDSVETIKTRLKNAKKEINCLKDYDYLVTNDNLKNAVSQLFWIINAERRKVKRLKIKKNQWPKVKK